MTPQEGADNSHAMTRRTFIKTGSLLVGGTAVSGLKLETASLTYAAGDEGRILHEGNPDEVGISQARLDDLTARLQNRIDRGLIPGATIWVARHAKTVLHRAFGVRQVGKDAMTEDTLFDLESNTKVLATDLTYRLLGHVLQTATGQNLQQFAKANVWSKLGMNHTTYNPLDNSFTVSEIAATGPGSWNLRTGTIRGVVEDDFDWVMGGIVGCDGLFSTARDIAVFLQMMLNGGTYGGVRIISPWTVRMMTADQTSQVTEATDTDPLSNLLFTHKGYGWELWTHRFSSGGMRLTPGSFGKAGGAGTFFWVDPQRDMFAVILTNHGLPVPFDANGWARMLDAIGVYQFFDGVINSLNSEH